MLVIDKGFYESLVIISVSENRDRIGASVEDMIKFASD